MSLSSLLASAHPLVASRFDAATHLPDPHPACVLFFSLSDGSSRARVCHAAGANFTEAWRKGVAQCQRVAQSRKLYVRWLRVDWVTAVMPTTWGELDKLLRNTKRNYFRYGLAVDPEFRHAFLEQELNANALLYAGNTVIHAQVNRNNFQIYTRRRFGDAYQADYSPDTPVWRFASEGIFLTADEKLSALPGEMVPQHLAPPSKESRWRALTTLNSGRRQIDRLDAESVYALIDSSANFLARQVKKSGQFIYGHFPCFGREIPTYNSLRHASTIYSMLEAWELTREDSLLAAIKRALAYLANTLIRRYPQAGGATLAYNVDINGEIKLGANAVSLLALVKYDELTGDTRYRPLMEELALGVARMQDADSGSFVHVLNAEDLTLKEAFRIVYYDGEAAFGLMRLYGLTRDPRWLAIVEKAFDYFISANHWKHHDHWLSYCANELTLHKPEEKYFRFGMQNIAGYLNFIQTRETTFPTLLELSMAFHKMLERLEQMPEMQHVLQGLDVDKFYRALHHRAHYLLNGFFWPEIAMYFAKPSTIVGSFFIRHHTFRVRIDDVEHYLSGYVAYWKMLREGRKTDATAGPDVEAPADAAADTSIKALTETAIDNTAGARAEAAPMIGPAEDTGNTTEIPASTRTHAVWGGDVNLGRRQHYRSAELGIENVLDIPALKQADLAIINLECVVTHLGEQGLPKGEGGPYYYRARPEMLRVLTAANIDVVTTANNHGGDYGPEALLNQGRWLDAVGIGHTGSGSTLRDALKPVYRRAGDLNVAVFSIDATMPRFGATNTQPGTAYLPISDPEKWRSVLGPPIATARRFAHIVLVAVHWGPNGAEEPGPAEKTVGRALIDAGADAVLGASAHVLQGIELYQGRPIIHDAGDLLFDSVRGSLRKGGVFRLELSPDGVKSVAFIPVGIGFGFSRQLTGGEAIAAAHQYAEKCAALGSQMTVQPSGEGLIRLSPPARERIQTLPAPQTRYRLEALSAADGNENPAWRVTEVPDDARISPTPLGPLTLLGARVSPLRIVKREMLWVETFWKTDEALNEDLRLDIQAVPLKPTRMQPWGKAMDHDPCDWNIPTSRWEPGVIYRDYYGLRPPYLRNWENVDLQLIANIVPNNYAGQALALPLTIELAVPGKDQNAPLQTEKADGSIRHAFSSSELKALTEGVWAYTPKDEIHVDYFVTGAGLVENPRTCMVCMFYETWLKGTGNSGHYKNIFSDSHVSFPKRYKQLHLEDKINCLIVQRPIPEMAHIPQLVVKDSYEALKILADTARHKMADNGTVFAVTGAVGKSTTCDLLTRCVRPFSNCIAMTNGHNSRTGVTIWAASLGMFDPKFNNENSLPNACILEVAGSALWMKSGWVMKATRPNISIITHIELTQYGPNSRTIEDVAYFKSRICESMHENGKVVLYKEMPLYEKVLDYVIGYGAQAYCYGEGDDADSRLLSYHFNLPTVDNDQVKLSMTVKADVLGEEVSYDVGAVGKPVALNSLAALTAAKLAGFDVKSAADQLLDFKARKNTLDIFTQNKVLVLDCSHNLELPSILAAFDVLKASTFSKKTRRIVIMSRIVNMGDISPDFHLNLEEPLKEYGFDKLFIHNPDHEWDKLLPRLPDSLLGGESTNAQGTVAQFLEYVRQEDTVLILGASRGCDFGQVLPGILKQMEIKFGAPGGVNDQPAPLVTGAANP